MENIYIVLLSGSLPLLGVALTLWHNRKLQKDRVQIEESRRNQDREFSNKRDALICASEAVLRFINYFITLPDRDLPTNGKTDEEISNLGIALYGLHFYCDVNTIEYSTRLGKTLTLALSEAIKAKMASAFLKEDIKNNLIQVQDIEDQIKVSQEEVRALLFSNPQSPTVPYLKEKISEKYSALSALHSERSELHKVQWRETEKCRDVVISNLREIHEALRDVLLLARKELQFPIEEERYEKIMSDAVHSAEEHLKELFTEIRAQIESRMQ